ncbi:MAG: hypothetical protein HY885_02450 [Deltaproteobacteria bacterium]|nr:hypothetical protein [Deltaproteobacteria bacterium]
MLKKFLCSLALPATLTITFAASSWATVPPPPVNQNMGIPDGVFNNLVEANCRGCHEDTTVVKPETIPNRHHLLVGKVIPDPTAAPHGVPGAAYECLSCHQLVWSDVTYSYSFVSFRDCLLCHEQQAGQASVHHLTAKAQANDCKACHGPIDNPGDGHYIPSYAPSLVTPQTGIGTGANGEGGCAFCHNAGVDAVSGITVYSNATTHHSTGLGIDSTKCVLCHDTNADDDAKVRQCEACHGVKSLHNIQVDSDGDGIDPGTENAYFGHIGKQDDCWGCHGFTALSAPYSGPVIPDITSLSDSTITAGFATQLTITGVAFSNMVQTPTGPIELTSTICLKAADGSETVLTPDSVSENTIVVMVPATMSAGSYAVTAVKGTSVSNSVNLAIMPQVKVASASCASGVVSISGSGFSQYVNATGSGTGVSLPDAVAGCTVLSWTDTSIEANCGECDPSITVDSVYGEATGAVTVKKAIIKKPVRK